MSNYLIILCLFFNSIFVGDPVILSSTQILSKAIQDPKLKSKQDLQKYALQQKYRLPFLSSTELRAGTKTLIFDESRYSMRFGFNSFRERQALRKFPKLHSDVIHTEYLNQLNSKLLDYNKLILEYFSKNIELQYKDSLIYFLKLKNDLYGRYLNQNTEIKLKDLVNNVEDMDKWVVDRNQTQLLKSNLLEKFKSLMNTTDPIEVSYEQLVTLQTIEKQINLNLNITYSSIVALQKSSELNLTKQNILLEKRKERNWLSYFQMEYTDSDKALGLNENLSARVGIKLPLGGSSNKKIRELELDARSLEDQISILDTIRVFSQRVNLNFLKSKIEDYKKAKDQLNHSIIDKLLLNPGVLNQLTSEDLIDIRINKLKQNYELTTSYLEIVGLYINFLSINDQLVMEPLTDYLTDQMLPIR